jgi:molybdopterin molybdotransferase
MTSANPPYPNRLLTVGEALDRVLERARPLKACRLELALVLQHVLAEPVRADNDSPPFDKSLVDGYAVSMSDVRALPVTLNVAAEVTAGNLPAVEAGEGRAIRVMTGAPIPSSTEAVVMLEDTELLPGPTPTVRLVSRQVVAGQNIMRRGFSYAKDQELLRPGKLLQPADIGLLAETGHVDPLVRPRVRVAILSTGNELVPASDRIAAGQIRNSNGPMLQAQVTAAGGVGVPLGIARDESTALEQAISQGLQSDMLLISGGVSAGVLDLVPQTLQQLGVQQVFHKVNLKPGKPLWFGLLPGAEANKLVFGLPGNPVSSLVCFELFVLPAMMAMMERAWARPYLRAELSDRFQQRGDRPTFFPGWVERAGERLQAKLLDWRGSADLRTLTDANCLVHFPAGEQNYPAGSPVDVYLLGVAPGLPGV